MRYTKLTEEIIELIKIANTLLREISELKGVSDRNSKWQEPFNVFFSKWEQWYDKYTSLLKINSFELEILRIEKKIQEFPKLGKNGYYKNEILDKEKIIHIVIEELLDLAFKIEDDNRKKVINQVFIDDFDDFKEYLMKAPPESIEKKFLESAFLEDDVENVFLEILKEPYKEQDSGSETRDLYTDKLYINKKRHSAVIMFKGRGVKGTLKLKNCGKNGDQLLKLAKNTFSQVYIVQHVNKIEPDILETLRDHLFAHSKANNIKICLIDGLDTARILKGYGKDLEALKAKK